MQVLIVNPHETLPPGGTDLFEQIGCDVTTTTDYRTAIETARAGNIDAVIASVPNPGATNGQTQTDFANFLGAVRSERIATIVVSDDAQAAAGDHALVAFVGRDVTPAELRGRLATIDRYQGVVRGLGREVAELQRIGKRLNEHFAEVEQEMRLAARLQRDFLPRLDAPFGRLQFSAMFRPATWVSGDIFDLFRVDEKHVGFYIADAVGHGMAASLLTMFIKRTMVPKRIHAGGYEIVTPSKMLATLNESLTEQALPHCQFVTAWYGLINIETLELQFARGGHPHPMLFSFDGTASELKASGGLLGLFDGEQFATERVQLQPGDKLLLYTDGVELAFKPNEDGSPDINAYRKLFLSIGHLPIQEAIRQIEEQIVDAQGSLDPRDDITVFGMEILRD